MSEIFVTTSNYFYILNKFKHVLQKSVLSFDMDEEDEEAESDSEKEEEEEEEPSPPVKKKRFGMDMSSFNC